MSANVLEITDSVFDTEVLKSTLPVIVDLWAPWCGPCRMLAPLMETLAGSYRGKLKITKINTDDNPEMSTKYQVMAIPTLLFFKQGQLVERSTGVKSQNELEEIIRTSLGVTK
ncbi:MAG: thioredoxin [Planctomycetota bacterium]